MTAALVAGGVVLAGAGPAAAQHPGRNGEQVVLSDSGPRWECGSGTSESAYYLDYSGATGAQGGAYSPDGKVLAVNAEDVYRERSGVLLVTGPSSDTTCAGLRFLPGAIDTGTHLAFSPDGKSIAIQRASNVQIISASTGALVRNLTPGLPAGTYAKDPTWDPKGRAIAYTATDGIRTRPPGGGAGKLLIKGTGLSRPEYSPDGRYLAYLTGGYIAYADAVTGKLVKRTPIKAVDFRYSPDGLSFVFSTGVANFDGANCPVANLNGKITSRVYADAYCEVVAWQPLR